MDLEFPGELICRPTTLKDLAADNMSLGRVYAYARSLENTEIEHDLSVVLRMASDFLCNTCHEMHVDPMILDYWDGKNDIIVTPFEPTILDDEE